MKPLHERKDEGDLTPEEWKKVLEEPLGKRAWLTDSEACLVATTTVRTMQILQTAEAITSTKAAKAYGGFRRVWRIDMVYLASVATELMRQFDWSIAKASAVLRLLVVSRYSKPIIEPLVVNALSGPDPDPADPTAKLIQRQKDDWFLSVHDGTFVFLKAPEDTREALGAVHPEFPIGVFLAADMVAPISYQFEDANIFEDMVAEVGRLEAERLRREVEACRAAFSHSRAGVWVDISMPIRAAQRRIKGLDVRYIEDVAMDLLIANWQQSLDGGEQ